MESNTKIIKFSFCDNNLEKQIKEENIITFEEKKENGERKEKKFD